MNNENELKKTYSLEVPSNDIDEFDTALENEKKRTEKAEAAAEHVRKKYGDAKDIIRELETQIKEKDQTIERKNLEIASLRKADRTSREVGQVESKGELEMLQFVAGRMLGNNRAR